MNALFNAIYNNCVNSAPSMPDIVYVVRPSYVSYRDAIDSAVFITHHRANAYCVMDLLNNSDNDIVKRMHNMAKDIIQPAVPTELKFKINRFSINMINAWLKQEASSTQVHYDFLMTDLLINQVRDKINASKQNDTIFDSASLQLFRKSLYDKHIV